MVVTDVVYLIHEEGDVVTFVVWNVAASESNVMYTFEKLQGRINRSYDGYAEAIPDLPKEEITEA